MKRFRPTLECFEPRIVPTLVFIFNGNGFAPANPDATTQIAAAELRRYGDPSVQLSTPSFSDPAAYYALASEILSISKGQPIGLMGFSAGGAEALRLSELPNLNVRAVMNYYGPPDLQDWLTEHKGDIHYQHVTSNTQFDQAIINLMSGPIHTSAYLVNAWGMRDHTVVASFSTQDFHQDSPKGDVFYYAGGHGVDLFAQVPAFRDFVSHL